MDGKEWICVPGRCSLFPSTMFVRLIRSVPTQTGCIKPHKRFQSTSNPPKQYTVTLDNETLYINEDVARALGWTPETGHAGVKLTLHGWEPRFFAITPTGSDSGQLSILFLLH